MKSSIFNMKISWPLLVTLFAVAVGALSGQFVWTLIAAFSLLALACVAQNMSAFLRGINTCDQTTLADANGEISSSLENSGDRLQKWNEEVNYCPTYKGTPGNIWNGPKWASDD